MFIRVYVSRLKNEITPFTSETEMEFIDHEYFQMEIFTRNNTRKIRILKSLKFVKHIGRKRKGITNSSFHKLHNIVLQRHA